MKKKKIKEEKQLEPVKLRLPVALTIIFIFIWVYIVLTNYYKLNPISTKSFNYYFSLIEFPKILDFYNIYFFLKNFVSVLLVLVIFFTAYFLGNTIFNIFKFNNLSKNEEIVFSLPLGLGVIILILFFVGILGLLYKSIVAGFMFIIFIYATYKFFSSREKYGIQQNQLNKVKLSKFEILWFLIGLMLLFVILIGCFSPEIFYDSLVYHLAKPNFWINTHKIMPNKAKTVTNFYPSYANILFMIGLFLKDETLCKLMNFVFNMLTAFSIYVLAKRFSDRKIGILSAFFFFFIPYAGIISYRSAMEMYLAFFETVTIFAILLWMQSKDVKWLIISALNCGLAMGGKYTSIYCLMGVVFILLVKGILEKETPKLIIRNIVIFSLISFVVFLPWIIYNIHYTGNPFYPFFASKIGFLKPRSTFDPSAGIYTVSNWIKNLMVILKGPWTVTMGQHEEAFIGPIFLSFLPIVLLFKPKFNNIKYLGLYIVIYWFIWANGHSMYVRYFMPAMPVVSFLTSYSLFSISINNFLKNLFFLLVTVIFVGNLLFVMNIQKFSNNCLGVVFGLQSKFSYLATQRSTYPNPYYSAAQWINENTSDSSNVLFLGELRTYYIKRNVIMFDISDYVPLIVWAGNTKTEDDLYKKLISEKVTHFLVSPPELKRLNDTMHWEGEDLITFSKFWNKYVKEVHRSIADISIPSQGIYSMKQQHPQWWENYASDPHNYVYVYEIMSKEEAEKPHKPPYNFFLEPQYYSKERWHKLEPLVNEFLRENKL